ncbi:family 20 glycosylhydrolase [uncultured Bacteroides sp.]|uniref:family 20 glycosylhydrolase n=1 Tax=uncultured Bacteroides sp. TaxID=162156 RepID=UPI002AA75199|nr:family 20 glycosylhydrolase [uncultured Bacteroides sp.]
MKKISIKFLLLVYLISFMCSAKAEQVGMELPLIPYPQHLERQKGYFILSPETRLIVHDEGRFVKDIAYFQSLITPLLGRGLNYESGKNSIEFDYTAELKEPEAYRLSINPDKIIVEASGSAGAFYAIQTIRQLLPVEVEIHAKAKTLLSLPALQIFDCPAFSWRGCMIDVSRHFFSIDYLKKQIDRMALFKMNKLHLHLTDDQGWRIEIKKYPELTIQGAWRVFNNQDTLCMEMAKSNPDLKIDQRYIINKDGKQFYGGYYTQDQIRDLVSYATFRHVDLIPEIDMPGHMLAAIAEYPYLAGVEKIGWGKTFTTPLCPCKEDVYTFVDNVLSEVMDLFPSKYIHIGADEVDKTVWSHSELCKKFMKDSGIKDFNELQTYFVHRVTDFIKSKGRQSITWDDAIDGNLDSSVNVMYWRGWVHTSLPKAARNGNPIIMSPTSPLYFDYIPDRSSLEAVYYMNVAGADFPVGKVFLIKGAQANMWTEKIPSEQRADFMLFPRLTALAERLWTHQDLFESYSKRLLANYPRLDAMKVHYRLPDLSGFAQESVFVKETAFKVDNPFAAMAVHYTTDGAIPTIESEVLAGPLKVTQPVQIRFALFSPSGAHGDIYTVNYRKVAWSKPVHGGHFIEGLSCSFYDGLFKNTSAIKSISDGNQIVDGINVPKDFVTKSFALKYTGYIKVPDTGIYTFYLTCDDGGKLYIDNGVVVDNDGLHSAVERTGQVALSKGAHRFALDFIEGGGGFTLKLKYSIGNNAPKDVPSSWLIH